MIRFDSVTKRYRGGTRPALDAVSLEIVAGEFVFLVGASGSGKSSLLRLILREDRPTSGEIHVLGQRLNTISSRKIPYFHRTIGVVFQDFRLLPAKSVHDNVAFSLQVIGKSRGFIREAVPDVLSMVGLADKARSMPHELSGGEQQRVAIARAVVNRPAVLLADEPTGNLDPTTSEEIMEVLHTINLSGTTVVMATHDVTIVDRMQRRVVELIDGRIVRDEARASYVTSAIQVQAAAPDADPAPAAPAWAAATIDRPRAVPAPVEPAASGRTDPEPVRAEPVHAEPARAEEPSPIAEPVPPVRPWPVRPETAPVLLPQAPAALRHSASSDDDQPASVLVPTGDGHWMQAEPAATGEIAVPPAASAAPAPAPTRPSADRARPAADDRPFWADVQKPDVEPAPETAAPMTRRAIRETGEVRGLIRRTGSAPSAEPGAARRATGTVDSLALDSADSLFRRYGKHRIELPEHLDFVAGLGLRADTEAAESTDIGPSS